MQASQGLLPQPDVPLQVAGQQVVKPKRSLCMVTLLSVMQGSFIAELIGI
jgi:hypothetical protein